MEFCQVVLARVADDENHHTAFVEVLRNLQRRRKIRPGRSSAEDSFTSGKLTRELERFAIGDVYDLVDDLHIGVSDRQRLTDSFDKVGRRFRNVSGIFVAFEYRTVRVGADDLDLWIFFFQIAAGPGDGSA